NSMTDVITPAVLSGSGAATATTAAIPAARVVHATPGTWRVTGGSHVAGPDSLQGVMRRFADDVATDSGIVLEVALDGAPGDVLVEVDVAGLEDIPFATGVRADGLALEDADERSGLDISPDGARVWGATPEAVHRALTTLRQLITAAVADGVAEVPCARIT